MPTVTFAAMTNVSVKIAKLCIELQDWKAVQVIMLEERALPQKTLSGQKRVFAERNYYFPIGLEWIADNPNLVENPGYTN